MKQWEEVHHRSGSKLKKRPLVNVLRDIFLPRGYPDSVTPDYANYQLWDTLQAFCSTITGLLTTQAMLTGMGVGDSEATSYSALLTWVLQDGTGMIGRIFFAWRFASAFDYNVKTWRLAADYLNDIGMTLCLLAPRWPTHKVLIMCFGSLFKSLCGVAGGATRGALTQHFAKENNTGDVSAKDGSQETVINLVGMIVGTYLISWLNGSELSADVKLTLTWLLFAGLTLCHLYANGRAVQSVVMHTLNLQRTELLLFYCDLDSSSSKSKVSVYSPEQVAQSESIFFYYFTQLIGLKPSVRFGVPPSIVIDFLDDKTWEAFRSWPFCFRKKGMTWLIAHDETIQPHHQFQALYCIHLLSRRHTYEPSEALKEAENSFPSFWKSVRLVWPSEKSSFFQYPDEGYRYRRLNKSLRKRTKYK